MDDDKYTTHIYAGSWQPGFINGGLLSSRFNSPFGMAFDTNGNLFVADSFNHIIRMINVNGTFSTFVGMPGSKEYRDGTRWSAQFDDPTALAFERKSGGNLFVADTSNRVICMISTDGMVSTFAGTTDSSGDKNAQFHKPREC
jgi:DNA-binding beta-propeller fold protein YncE